MTMVQPAPIVTPAQTMGGRVSRVNTQGNYVVLTFPIGTLPPVNQQLSLYRNGLKVGEVRITNLQIDNSTVADIVSGEARLADEVR